MILFLIKISKTCVKEASVTDNVLLNVQQSYEADSLAIDAGIPGLQLMEAAGTSIAAEIMRRYPTLLTAMALSLLGI